MSARNRIQEINKIIDSPYQSVKIHINKALALYSDRKKPDYENSIKESISAVESYCALITNDKKATLGQALKQIEQKTNIHPALKKSSKNFSRH